MKQPFILAIDQGTSSTKTLIFDAGGQVVARTSEPLKTHYYGDGYVEQDPEAIYQNVLTSVGKCLDAFTAEGGNLSDILTCGISNQRETFIIWDADGKPLYNAVVWQCKRSISICERLKAGGLEPPVRAKTGLFIDPYFSGTKLMWLAENVHAVREAIHDGNAYFGTVDTWLLYKFTNGAEYATDYTNASRTLFFNLQTLRWDEELLALFGLSGLNLPQPKPSSAHFGTSQFNGLFDHLVPITAMIGDSHAAAFGEGCFEPGTAKATLGTGCSILMNIGPDPKESGHGLISTICWSTEDRTDYALEGVIVTCGATMEWLKNELGLFQNSRDTEAMALAVPDNGGVYLIPAFSGLGAPHWQMDRKASISGLTFGTTKNHLVRAALESIPFQLKDVLVAMEQDTGIPLAELMVNGGLTSNRFVLQLIADLLGTPVINKDMPDVSAKGAAYLAGLKAGIFTDLAHVSRLETQKSVVSPNPDNALITESYAGWQSAIAKGSL
ncbi:glycerol kinase GlpK [Nibrella viscosa]|uniref:ATP:glycerol 3-phosphotransferase n=1 Tax=Nibrella viscosa TaxID=1084524 RepID=A0ABP8JRC6_9BACT